ncbi:MAG: PorV/PorQ family protein [Candidatus Cloacimonetes bacterium]|nr:PorV/PorQ family protein [Candidatus Cloacimonadota bacterium]
MKSKLFYIALIILTLVPIAINGISNYAVLFLLIEPGSRPGAMGSSYVAQVDDGFAGYWNAGALAFNRKTQFAGMHSNWFGPVQGLEDMYYEYLGWNQYFEDIGNIGVNITYITYGKQSAYDEDEFYLGDFGSYDISFATTYGFQLKENTGLGLTFKFIYSSLVPANIIEVANLSSSKGYGVSYAFDLGWKQKNLFINKLDFGINLQNVGPNIIYDNKAQSEPLPMNWRMGFSYRILDSKLNKLTANADMNKALANDDAVYKRIFTAWFDDSKELEYEEIIYNFGAEYVYLDLLSLRAGYISDRAGEIQDVSLGAGVHHTFSNMYKVYIDFALQPAGDLLKYNKTFSIKVDF